MLPTPTQLAALIDARPDSWAELLERALPPEDRDFPAFVALHLQRLGLLGPYGRRRRRGLSGFFSSLLGALVPIYGAYRAWRDQKKHREAAERAAAEEREWLRQENVARARAGETEHLLTQLQLLEEERGVTGAASKVPGWAWPAAAVAGVLVLGALRRPSRRGPHGRFR